jgi:anthranilate/para-aminobenzoate synthase component I
MTTVDSAVGTPQELVGCLEELFGSVLYYREPTRTGRRHWYVPLADADVIRAGEPGVAARVTAAFDSAEDAARSGSGPGEVFFALSYDLAVLARAEQDGRSHHVPPGTPLAVVTRPTTSVAVTEPSGALTVQSTDRVLRHELTRRCALSHWPSPAAPSTPLRPLTTVLKPIDVDRYHWQVSEAMRAFERGDSYQLVVSTSTVVRPTMSVPEYFAATAQRYAHATYSYWLAIDGMRVFGNCFLPHVTHTGDTVSSVVLAGTQAGSTDPGEQAVSDDRLTGDPKYFGEHLMLVDVERNDLGQFCQPGTVAVRGLRRPLRTGPTTYLATHVTGRVDPDTNLATTVLRTFPRGVVVGAPKRRAQELLDDIEDTPRGFYTGAIGLYRPATSRLVSNTIVTCAQQQQDELVLRCAGGLTIDSDVNQELAELALTLKFLV